MLKKFILGACFALLLTSCSEVETPNVPDSHGTPTDAVEDIYQDDESIVETPTESDEPVVIPADEIVQPTEIIVLAGAALGSVEENVSPEFQFMSPDMASSYTNGALGIYLDKCTDDRTAYLTPSGKLVYINEWTFSKLPEGTVDFKVDWSSSDSSCAPVNIKSKDYRSPKGIISLDIKNVEISDVKYELYVDLLEDMGGFSSEASFGCYGVAVEGSVSYTYGFKVNSDEYNGKTLKVTVSDIDGNSQVYSGSTDDFVIAGNRERSVTSSDWLTWNAVAEILDSEGNVLYTESFMFNEYEDFANLIEIAIPMQ